MKRPQARLSPGVRILTDGAVQIREKTKFSQDSNPSVKHPCGSFGTGGWTPLRAKPLSHTKGVPLVPKIKWVCVAAKRHIVLGTTKAVLIRRTGKFRQSKRTTWIEVFLPKSQINYEWHRDSKEVLLFVPDWLAKEKKLPEYKPRVVSNEGMDPSTASTPQS